MEIEMSPKIFVWTLSHGKRREETEDHERLRAWLTRIIRKFQEV